MKKLSIYLLLALFSLQNPSWADDIRDFQIEGMSIGDSLLDYFSKSEIKKGKKNYFKDNEFSVFEIELSDSKIYDGFQALYKTKDNRYIIYSMLGVLDCRNDFTVCKKKWKKIIPELIEFFKNDTNISDVENYNHRADKSGKSKVTQINFIFNSGDEASVQMTDWSKKTGYWDSLRISLETKEVIEWLKTKAYK